MTMRLFEIALTASVEAEQARRDESATQVARSSWWRQAEHLPISLFGSVMGLAGLSVAWRYAAIGHDAPIWLAGSIGALAVVAFVVLTVSYAVKMAAVPDAVRAEYSHPIAGNLFGTFLVSLLLLPIILAPVSLLLAQAVWVLGTVGMLGFAWVIVNRWMSDRQQVAHATPAWIVPVVGLLDVPLAVPSLDLPSMHGVMVLGLAVGLFFAVPLFTLIFSRLVFEPPMPDALQPTLLILVAPFAVGFSAYVTTTGQVDLFAQSLYVLTLFVLTVLVGRLRFIDRCCPFKVSWWAVSFPLAASAIAALRFAAAEPGLITDTIALSLLGIATLTIAGLLVRTLFGIALGELRAMSA